MPEEWKNYGYDVSFVDCSIRESRDQEVQDAHFVFRTDKDPVRAIASAMILFQTMKPRCFVVWFEPGSPERTPSSLFVHDC